LESQELARSELGKSRQAASPHSSVAKVRRRSDAGDGQRRITRQPEFLGVCAFGGAEKLPNHYCIYSGKPDHAVTSLAGRPKRVNG
jgi:hypothetical protein